MECPHCKAELRLAGPVPASLANAFVYLTCPSNRCGLIGRLADEPELMTVRAGHRLAKHMTKATAAYEWVLAGVVTVAAIVLFGLLGVRQFLTPAPATHGPGHPATGNDVFVVFIFGAFGVFSIAACMFGGFYVDELIAREKWRESLPHATLSFVAVPKAYRA